jgi:hypothetical protein
MIAQRSLGGAIGGALLFAAPAIASAQHLTVGQNVLVSADQPSQTHFEMRLAASPEHADRLVACSMVMSDPDRPASKVGVYVSLDRGQTWKNTLNVRSPLFAREAWDPDCTYGPGGTLYNLAENIDSLGRAFLQIDRSSDGGVTWQTPSRIKHNERSFITVDNTLGPRRGWLYFHGQSSARPLGGNRSSQSGLGVQVSRDSGRTAVSSFIPSGGRDYVIGAGPGAVLSDGTFVGLFAEINEYYQSDGRARIPENELGRPGSSWANASLKVITVKPEPSSPYIVAHASAKVADLFSPWPGWNKSVLANLTADLSNGPFKDRLYASWADVRSGRSDVYLSYSSDMGKTWSVPRRIPDDRSSVADSAFRDNLQGIVAVNPQGVVAVCWYDRRDRPDNLSWTPRCTASLDGGDTVAPSVVVSDKGFDASRIDRMAMAAIQRPEGTGGAMRTKLGVHSFNFSGGHTIGLAADAGGDFHFLWTGNPTGVPQLWTARVSVSGTVAKNGGGALEKLADVSSKISVAMTNVSYVPATNLLEADLLLENTSKDTVTGPFTVRVLDVASILGAARLENADNGLSGGGALFDFSSLVPGGALLPGQKSASKQLRMRAQLFGPLHTTMNAVAEIATLRTKVLAPPPLKASAAMRP